MSGARALGAAFPAVGWIRGHVHTRAVTAGATVGAFAGAAPAITELIGAAARRAAATMCGIGADVDASTVALTEPLVASDGTLAVTAGCGAVRGGVTGLATFAAVVGALAQVDAAAVTALQAVRAADHTG